MILEISMDWESTLENSSLSPSDEMWSCQLQDSAIQDTDNICLLSKPLRLLYFTTATSPEKPQLTHHKQIKYYCILLPKVEEMKFIIQIPFANPASYVLELKVYMTTLATFVFI